MKKFHGSLAIVLALANLAGCAVTATSTTGTDNNESDAAADVNVAETNVAAPVDASTPQDVVISADTPIVQSDGGATDTTPTDAAVVESDAIESDASMPITAPAGTQLWWAVNMPIGERVSIFEVERFYRPEAGDVLYMHYLFDGPIAPAGGTHAFMYAYNAVQPYSASLELRARYGEEATRLAVVDPMTGRCRQVTDRVQITMPPPGFEPVRYELIEEPVAISGMPTTYCFTHILGWDCPPGRTLNTDGTCSDRH